MSDDLASQALGYTSGNKLTLWEKRQQYEDWLQSGRRTPKPIVHVHTGVAHTRIDDVEPTKERKPPEVGTLNDLPPGAVVRIDEGNERVDISDDLRLDMGKALIKKADGADAATAERIANAVHNILSPIARVDDDADLKNKVLKKSELGKPKSPGAMKADEDEKPRKAVDEEDEPDAPKEPTLADVIAALVKLNGRMDTIEGKKKDDHDEEDDSGSEDVPTRGAPGKPGAPKEMAADDTEYRSDAFRRRTRLDRMDAEIHSWKNQDRFAAFQSRADQVSQLFGKSASPPIAGETLGAYKRRTVREWQKFSPAFKNSDLKVLQIADSVAFNVAVEDILARADKEGRNPSQVPMGYLAERSEVRGGHTFTKFYGRPSTWMNQFAPTGKRVRRIIERSDSGISRTLYERA